MSAFLKSPPETRLVPGSQSARRRGTGPLMWPGALLNPAIFTGLSSKRGQLLESEH